MRPIIREGDRNRLFELLTRVRIEKLDGELGDEALTALLRECDQVLCIVNTRGHARAVFEALRGEPGARHLSTWMCAAHLASRGDLLLRREQYRRTDDGEKAAQIASAIVVGKTLNQRTVLRRALRDHGEAIDQACKAALRAAEERLSDVARRTTRPEPLDVIRGYEGEAGQIYFAVFDHLIRAQKETFRFAGRSRRPPLDAVNALLSFLYTLLVHDCRGALEAIGLDPAVGFLHRDRPGRPSLALDLMEEFRAMMADRLALSLINRRQIGTGDFRAMENGAVLLTDDVRKLVLVAYQERKREEITHAFLQETAPIGLLPYLQAQLLARHLRGDLDGYPPFVWK